MKLFVFAAVLALIVCSFIYVGYILGITEHYLTHSNVQLQCAYDPQEKDNELLRAEIECYRHSIDLYNESQKQLH